MNDPVGEIFTELHDNILQINEDIRNYTDVEYHKEADKYIAKAKTSLVKWIQGKKRETDPSKVEGIHKAQIVCNAFVYNNALDSLCDEIMPNWRKE